MPVVVVVVFELEPHPAWARAMAAIAAVNKPSRTLRLREIPAPISPIPPTPKSDSHTAYMTPPGWKIELVVVTRAVVLI